MDDLDYRPQKGLFIKPRWAESALAMLPSTIVIAYEGLPINRNEGLTLSDATK
ncbi:phage protease [Ferrimonas balearica]|uniref:phage protease n=1 Tax=Ferrimonas balearica TaxID=44012 RepID=UPI001C974149|nr:phage protease [Ferrimonas balearica]MBY6223547.1 phage protease [Ferrimonas balearica]